MRVGTLLVVGLTILAAFELMSAEAGKRRSRRGKGGRKNRSKNRENRAKRPRREIIPGKFKNDRQVRRYLKILGTDIMIWRCRDSINESYESEPIEFIELYCEVLGNIAKIEWTHNNKKLVTDGKRHGQVSFPHFYRGRFFYKWMDLLLRIPKVTTEDSGIYTIKVKGQSGVAEEHTIFVNIAQRANEVKVKTLKRKKRKDRRKGRSRRHKTRKARKTKRSQRINKP